MNYYYLMNGRATEMEQMGERKLKKGNEQNVRQFYIITQTKRAKKNALTMTYTDFQMFPRKKNKYFNLMNNNNKKKNRTENNTYIFECSHLK